jgi:hypothetical protein
MSAMFKVYNIGAAACRSSGRSNRRKTSGFRLASLAFGAALLAGAPAAHAVEGGIYGAPLGGTDARQAYLPASPGLYGGFAGVGVFSNKFTSNTGSSTDIPAYVSSATLGAGLLYVHNFSPWGFTLASSFQLNYQVANYQRLTVGGTALQGHGSGIQDSYSDLLYASHYLGLFGATPGTNSKLKYGLTGAIGLAAEIPIGAYHTTNFVTPGKNTFITIPNIAFTYLTGPNMSFFDGTEVSARFFFDTNKRNNLSGYQGGNLIDLDYALTQRMGNWQFGGAGVIASQITSDLAANGTQQPTAGNKYLKVDAGLVVFYDSPDLGSTFKFKALFPIEHENNYAATTIVLSVSRKLF